MPATKTKTPIFTISQQSLHAAIAAVMPAVASRPPQPIFSNLKVEVEADRLHFTAFDASRSISTSIKCDASAVLTQQFCIPAKYAEDIVTVLRGDLTLKIEDTHIAIASRNGKYKIPKLSSDSFPTLPTVESEPVSFTADSMRELLSVGFASSSDESRQVLCGVFLHFDGHTARSAATDGHRLAWTEVDMPYAVNRHYSFVLPANVASLLLKLAVENNIDMRIGDDRLHIEVGDITITSRLLVGQYPNYRQLIPNQFSRIITVDRVALLCALQRISVVASQGRKDKDGRGKIVKIAVDSTSIAISASGINAEEGREDVECQLTGDAIVFSGEAIFLVDALKANNCNEYRIQCNTPTSPIVFSPLSSAESVKSLLMPIQVRD